MDHQAAVDFAQRWAGAWNAHDLEAVLAHFTDDVVFTSPVAAQLLPGTGGVLRGKEALRAYWRVGLERIPDLRFDVVAVYAGVGTVVINYRNHTGNLVCEVLSFSGGNGPAGSAGLVREGHGTYLGTSAAAASGARD
jgi:hypothetical protein